MKQICSIYCMEHVYNMRWEPTKVLPQEVIQGAQTRGWLSVDLIIPSIPANRVFLETQELLFVAQHAAVVRVTDVIGVGQPLHIVILITCKCQEFSICLHKSQAGWKIFLDISCIIMWLTVSGEKLSEVDGKGDPVLADERVFVAPDTDIHGASARFWRQPSEVDRVLGEGVHAPTLSFISRKPVQTSLNIKALTLWMKVK